MSQPLQKFKPLKGRRLKNAMAAGIQWFSNFREEIDAINVFPVADGDTGKNMHQAFQAALKEIQAVRTNSVAEVAAAAARGAVLGGRGSSGMILSGFFAGFAEAVDGLETLCPEDFVKALHRGCQRARERVDNPREGTILTVGEAAATRAIQEAEKNPDLSHILASVAQAAKQALEKTSDQLQVLRENRVVDAGGLGLVCFLEGVVRYITRQPLVAPKMSRATVSRDHRQQLRPDKVYSEKYCMEFILRQVRLSREELQAVLKPMGQELMIAPTTAGTFKIHLHARDSQAVLERVQSLGTLGWHKIEDMEKQHQDVFGWRPPSSAPASRIAVVTDSTSDLPESRPGIFSVPLSLFFRDEEYMDGQDLSTEAFYSKWKACGLRPTTSQPPATKFKTLFEELGRQGYTHILVLTITRRFSGTFQSACNAGAGIPGLCIRVIDSRSVSAGLGMLALYARSLADTGLDFEVLIGRVESQAQRISIFFGVETLDSLIRGGRLGKTQAVIGKALRIRPVLAMSPGEGSIRPVSKAFTTTGSVRIAARLAAEHVRHYGICWGVSLIWAADYRFIPLLRKALQATGVNFGELQEQRIGAVVGTHLGPDGWGIVLC